MKSTVICPICQDEGSEYMFYYNEEWICSSCITQKYEKDTKFIDNPPTFEDWLEELDIEQASYDEVLNFYTPEPERNYERWND